MPSPSPTYGFAPTIGTMVSYDQEQSRLGFIGSLVAPVFETPEQSGVVGLIPIKQLLKEPDVGRNSRGGYNRTNYTFTTEAFATVEKGIEIPVDDRQSRMYRDFFNFLEMTVRNGVGIISRAAEKRWADLLFSETTFSGQTTAAGTVWSNYSGASPVTAVDNAKRAVWGRTGIWPNALVVSRHTFMHLRMCDEVTDKLHSEGSGVSIEPGKITTAQLASVFDVDRVLVAGGARDSANEGQAASVTSIWGNTYALVCRVAETNDIAEPCVARTLHWGQDGSQIGGVVEVYYSDETRGDIVRVRHEVQERVMYKELGELITGVTT